MIGLAKRVGYAFGAVFMAWLGFTEYTTDMQQNRIVHEHHTLFEELAKMEETLEMLREVCGISGDPPSTDD